MSTAIRPLRRAAVAGTWYPEQADELTVEVDRYLDAVEEMPTRDVVAIIAPHAGLIYSGPVAAYAYRALQRRTFDVAVLVGPSHFVGFDGVSIVPRGGFATPLGPAVIDAAAADRIRAGSEKITPYPRAHEREHSLELQLPFVRRVLPDTPIVPLVMGYQERETIIGLADALADGLAGTRALLIASTDLSHYFDADRAAVLDGRVVDHVSRFDWAGLLEEFEQHPESDRGRYVACGGGPAIAVMRAAAALGATSARVLKRADSGDVSGDKTRVVGYLAAVFDREGA
jgi:AmmeMemoRadiSam system protein B